MWRAVYICAVAVLGSGGVLAAQSDGGAWADLGSMAGEAQALTALRDMPCGEKMEDFGLFGYNIDGLGWPGLFSSAEECAAECKVYKNCNAISYRLRDKVCGLKNIPENKLEAAGRPIAGSSSFLMCDSGTCGQWLDGMRINGANLGREPTATREECKALCHRTKGCTAVVYIKGMHVCQLQGNTDSVDARRASSSEAMRMCIPDRCGVWEAKSDYNTKLTIENIAMAKLKSKEECLALCERIEGCDGVTWNISNHKKWGHKCWAKKLADGVQPVVHPQGMTIRMCPKD